MSLEDKNTIPGYLYFRDNERDHKIGLTNNLVVRGRAYKTENPRDTVLDYFSVETYAQAEAIEAEMKEAARAEGLCSFDNSDEWLERTDNTKAFWNRFVLKYAKKTHEEWLTTGSPELEAETTKLKNELVLIRSEYDYQCSESSNLRYQLRKANLVIHNNSQCSDCYSARNSELEGKQPKDGELTEEDRLHAELILVNSLYDSEKARFSKLEEANAELKTRFFILESKASQLAKEWKQHRSLFLGQEPSKFNGPIQAVVTDVLNTPDFEVTNLS